MFKSHIQGWLLIQANSTMQHTQITIYVMYCTCQYITKMRSCLRSVQVSSSRHCATLKTKTSRTIKTPAEQRLPQGGAGKNLHNSDTFGSLQFSAAEHLASFDRRTVIYCWHRHEFNLLSTPDNIVALKSNFWIFHPVFSTSENKQESDNINIYVYIIY